MKRWLYSLLLAPLCLLLAGCVDNVWLPDSSGFVCITREHTLVHYDLAKKTQRVVMKLDWLHSEEVKHEEALREKYLALKKALAADKTA